MNGRLCNESQRNALTLLELLVVLVILAIVATVAVNSLQPRVESTRFDQTRRLLETIHEASMGLRGSRQTDGTPLVSGFVADVGRLPRPDPLWSAESETGMELQELWNSNCKLATDYPFRFRSGPSSPKDYSQIQIPCGWRGPYLHLPIGMTRVTDSWGRPFSFEYSGDSTIGRVIWNPIGNFDQTLTCELNTGKVIVTGTLNFGQSIPSSVEVVLLAPDPDSSLGELGVFADEDDNPTMFAFTDVPIGLRAIHIQYDDRELTRYIQVPHQGLTMAFELAEPDE